MEQSKTTKKKMGRPKGRRKPFPLLVTWKASDVKVWREDGYVHFSTPLINHPHHIAAKFEQKGLSEFEVSLFISAAIGNAVNELNGRWKNA
jgi:hypothetical protein